MIYILPSSSLIVSSRRLNKKLKTGIDIFISVVSIYHLKNKYIYKYVYRNQYVLSRIYAIREDKIHIYDRIDDMSRIDIIEANEHDVYFILFDNRKMSISGKIQKEMPNNLKPYTINNLFLNIKKNRIEIKKNRFSKPVNFIPINRVICDKEKNITSILFNEKSLSVYFVLGDRTKQNLSRIFSEEIAILGHV